MSIREDMDRAAAKFYQQDYKQPTTTETKIAKLAERAQAKKVKLGKVTDEQVHIAGMNQTFDALNTLNTQNVDLISRTMNSDGTGNIFGHDKPLSLPVERATDGEYGYFGRPISDLRGVGGQSLNQTFNTPEQDTDYNSKYPETAAPTVFEPATLKNITDMDSYTIDGVTGGVGGTDKRTGVTYDLTGRPTEDRLSGVDAYEVTHDDPTSLAYFNSPSGIAKMNRQKAHLAGVPQEATAYNQGMSEEDARALVYGKDDNGYDMNLAKTAGNYAVEAAAFFPEVFAAAADGGIWIGNKINEALADEGEVPDKLNFSMLDKLRGVKESAKKSLGLDDPSFDRAADKMGDTLFEIYMDPNADKVDKLASFGKVLYDNANMIPQLTADSYQFVKQMSTSLASGKGAGKIADMYARLQNKADATKGLAGVSVKAGNFIAKGTGIPKALIDTEDTLEEVKKAGGEVTLTRAAQTLGIKQIENLTDSFIDKATFGMSKSGKAVYGSINGAINSISKKAAKETVDKAADTIKKSLAVTIGKTVKEASKLGVKLGVGLGVEGGTEVIQEAIAVYNERFGTDLFKDKEFLGMLEPDVQKRLVSSFGLGVLGAAGQTSVGTVLGSLPEGSIASTIGSILPSAKPDGDYVTSPAATTSLNTIHTAAAKEGFKDIASGKTPATPEQHAWLDGHIKVLEDEVNVIPDSVTGNTRDELIDVLATALSMKAAMNRGKGTILNSRPINDIENDIATENAKGDAADEKVLHRLSVEKAIAGLKTQSTGTEQVNVAKESGMSASDSHALKFYGGTVDNQRRTGLLEYIDALDGTDPDSKLHQQLQERLRHFIATQQEKLDEMEKAKKEYDAKFDAWKQNGEQGAAPSVPLSGGRYYDGRSEKGMLEPQVAEFSIMSKVGDRYLGTSNYSEPATATDETPQTETADPVTTEATIPQSTDYEQAANGEQASVYSNKQSTTGSTAESPVNNDAIPAIVTNIAYSVMNGTELASAEKQFMLDEANVAQVDAQIAKFKEAGMSGKVEEPTQPVEPIATPTNTTEDGGNETYAKPATVVDEAINKVLKGIMMGKDGKLKPGFKAIAKEYNINLEGC